MRNLKKNFGISSLFLALSSLSVTNAASAQETFTAEYFSQTTYAGEIRGTAVNTAVLNDIDLIRGNQNNESIFESDINLDRAPLQIFNGLLEYDLVNFRPVFTSGTSTISIYFKDGTLIDDVLAIRDIYTVYGVSTSLFLVDQQALLSLGKTMKDIKEISVIDDVEHGLNYTDFGFSLSDNITPQPKPEPLPEPPINSTPLNQVIGSDGRDNLKGTDENDYINGRGGSRDTLTGNQGFDLFVFGAEANNGKRDKDVILDFNPAEDSLVLEHGSTIKSIDVRGRSTIIKLNGKDVDNIRLRGVQLTLPDINIISVDGSYQ